ncbi:hypothetical protein [Actinoplanes sp. TFC3]|uniref:hypothetical protein n=1 Tax=Actinoplanes sp. TFC3 TaxID=1710355 RepID=UPI0012904145|nr:hypothetical protein [Actinoplanes sp. TFC3]
MAAVILVIVAATVMKVSGFDEKFRTATVTAACSATGCAGPGMAFAGWLMTLTPALYGLLAGAWFRRLTPVARVGLGTGGALLSVAALAFLPGRHGPDLGEMIRGAGSKAFAHGMLWGFGSQAAIAAVLIACAIFSAKRQVVVAAALLPIIAGGTFACLRAEDLPGYLTTIQVFPQPTVRVQDDILTRTSATDSRGCHDRFDGCLHTAEFEFTTTDSDTVVQFEVISFPDNDRAWDAWGEVREKTGNPATMCLATVTRNWLLVSTMRHSDNRAITPGEQKWLRWPAAQLEYAFRQAIGYTLLYLPEVSEQTAPRTP